MQVENPPLTANFGDRLAEAVERKRSQLVVGLDPRLDLLPVELRGDAHLARSAAADAVARFCCGIIDAVAPHAVAVKPQLAFFEALGSDGLHAFERTSQYARSAGLLVIADGKRGDIGSTARAYAAAYLESEAPVADALTINPYLGRDSVEPFLGACRRHGGGVFCLVKTSNDGGGDVQDVRLSDGSPLWHHVARLVGEWGEDLVGEHGLSSVGAVVGATQPRGGAAPTAAVDHAAAGRGRPGGHGGRCRAGFHKWARERASRRRPQRHLRLSLHGRGLAYGRGSRVGPAEERDLGRIGLVSAGPSPAQR
jgi:orotidine-5'-phosphate decarboxylase